MSVYIDYFLQELNTIAFSKELKRYLTKKYNVKDHNKIKIIMR